MLFFALIVSLASNCAGVWLAYVQTRKGEKLIQRVFEEGAKLILGAPPKSRGLVCLSECGLKTVEGVGLEAGGRLVARVMHRGRVSMVEDVLTECVRSGSSKWAKKGSQVCINAGIPIEMVEPLKRDVWGRPCPGFWKLVLQRKVQLITEEATERDIIEAQAMADLPMYTDGSVRDFFGAHAVAVLNCDYSFVPISRLSTCNDLEP